MRKISARFRRLYVYDSGDIFEEKKEERGNESNRANEKYQNILTPKKLYS